VSKEVRKAFAYLRTSSKTNVGPDKNSERRQLATIRAYAKAAGIEIVGEFSDPGVSGADPIETRPGFSELLDAIEGNGVRVVLVEDPSRFARDLVTQELGILALVGRGVKVLTGNGDDLTNTDDPFKVAMRQIAGAFVQLEKARLVAKLKAARERKRATGVKVDGRKSHAELRPEVVKLVKRLARKKPKGGQMSLRAISAALAAQGHLNERGRPFNPESVARMIAQSVSDPHQRDALWAPIRQGLPK
jgi:DNA invertase Pin-like site-specific DNA recombinase